MALITLGSIVAEIRGSINGTTYSRNRGGPYAKNKLTQTNPDTTYQQAARATEAAAVAAWQALTTTDQNTWGSFADSQYSKSRINGRRRLSGYTSFVRFYNYRNNYGLTGNPSPAQPVDIPRLTLNYVTLSEGAFIVNVTTFEDNSDWQIAVRASKPVSSGKTTVDKSAYAVIQYSDLTNGTTDFQLTSDYETHYGALSGHTGDKVFTRIDLVNRITAQHVIYLVRNDTIQASVNIAFQAAASNSAPNGNNVTIDLTSLTMQEGDLLLLQGGYATGQASKTPGPITGGWTSLFTHNVLAGQNAVNISYMLVGSTPPTSVQCAGSGNVDDAAAYIVRQYRGVNPLQLLDTTIQDTGDQTGTPNTNPAITTVSPQAMVVIVLAVHNDGTTGTVVGYSNTSHKGQIDTNRFGTHSANKLIASPATETPGAWSSGYGGHWIAQTLALRAELP